MRVPKQFVRARAVMAACTITAVAGSALAVSGAATGATARSHANTSAKAAGSKPFWCGSKPITLGIYDGGGLNAWSAESLAQVKQEAALCPAIKKEIVVDAGFVSQKGISGLQSMISQGVNAIVAIPDSGVCAELPTFRQATQRGIKVAIWAASGCGSVPADYQSYTDQNTIQAAEVATKWVAQQMGGKGNLLYLGGPAGNLVDQIGVKGMLMELKKFPKIKVLDNVTTKSWPVTNWSTAQAEKTTSGLLAKYPQINGIEDLYGADAIGDVAAFKQANRKIPPLVTTQLNSLSCEWAKLPKSQRFPLADESNRNWMGRLAVRQAVAAVNGIKDNELQSIPLNLIENSAQPGHAPKCYSQGPNYDPSNAWSDAQITAAATK